MGKENKEKKTKRTDLKSELDKQVAVLKTNCKDAAFFDSQIEKILSLKGQIDVEEVRLLIKEKDVLREYKGETFYIALTKKGAMFHSYSGYTVFATDRNLSSLYQTLAFFVDDMAEALEKADDEEKKNIETDMMAKLHILLAPTWCFSDVNATFEIATTVVHELNAMADRLENEPLKEEDEKANADFEEAVKGAEYIGEKLEEEKQQQ